MDKIGSDISSSEDELLTGEKKHHSPEPLDKDKDNLDDDQVSFIKAPLQSKQSSYYLHL